jgi:CheY-like chemotaxis protein
VLVDADLDLVDILLVEDSPTDVMMTQEALAYYKVLNPLRVVDDGVAAMEYLRRAGKHGATRLPGLILLDLNLPRKSGREVLREIKGDLELRKIPVIVLTTSKAEEDIVTSYDLHANCYITKPVDFTRFIDVVRTIEKFWFGVVTLPPAAP